MTDEGATVDGGPASDPLLGGAISPPKRIGRYHIKRLIATGGMGSVYEALQDRPRRIVALKVMRSGLASRSALRRFDYEAQLLARLRHPAIAVIHDAGTYETPEGAVPYFAMEYIPGARPITDCARQRKLGTRQRLELFETVCQAVHHGHTKGVIHRDLKPDNILIDSQGQVKIIDFGVARATDSDMAVTTLQTNVGQLIGTVQYMSPEQVQAEPQDLDTRSDVYSLGVVLYELLAGRPPYDVSAVPVYEAARVVRDEAPQRLSGIDTVFRGDIETIVHKALEKDRDRRYQSALELAADIRRYLNREPILARPPSLFYRAWVFSRRHRVALAAATGFLLALMCWAAVEGLGWFNAQLSQVRAEGLVEQLLSVPTVRVPGVVSEIEPHRQLVEPALRAMLASVPAESRRRLHISLALLPGDTGQVPYLRDHLLIAAPQEAAVILQALRQYAPEQDLAPDLWVVLASPSATDDRRLRAACALALFDSDNPRWKDWAELVAQWLVAQDPAQVPHWAEMLRPVSRSLSDPLIDLTARTNPENLPVVIKALEAYGEEAAQALEAKLSPGFDLADGATQDERDATASSRANLAVALLALGVDEPVWPLLRYDGRGEDPRLRTFLIHALPAADIEPSRIVDRLAVESDLSSRRALLLALGGYDPPALSDAQRQELPPMLLELFRREDTDPGVHAAAAWVLRRWGYRQALQEAMDGLRSGPSVRGAWHVNSEGHALVVIVEPDPFMMGSPQDEPWRRDGDAEALHHRRIPRTFAIAAHEVTVEQFLRFRPDHGYSRDHSPEPDCPINGVSRQDAMRYCNWLSEREGIPEDQWCYRQVEWGGEEHLDPHPDYLQRTGYRLPTEAEWEYACRAGAATPRHYGFAERLLERYAWYSDSSKGRTWPVGSLMPNDLGLFDALGNVMEWCQDSYTEYPSDADPARVYVDEGGPAAVGKLGVLRGASYQNFSPALRSAARARSMPTNAEPFIGFRIARTIPEG